MTNVFHTQRIFIIRVMELQSEIFLGENKNLYSKERKSK